MVWSYLVTWRDKIGKDFKYKVSVNTGYTVISTYVDLGNQSTLYEDS